MESILTSIKKLLGITEECKDFDDDIIIHINSVFMILNQIGVGPTEVFSIEDDGSVWEDFIQPTDNLQSVKTFIYLKVKLLFDPPLSGAVMESTNKLINELEWRLNVEAESK